MRKPHGLRGVGRRWHRSQANGDARQRPSGGGHVRRATVLLTGALIATQMTFVPAAFAADALNCSSDASHFAGMVVGGGAKHGAAATIEGQTLHICLSPGLPFETSGTFAWAALTDGNGSHPNTIIQMGLGRCREFANSDCSASMEYYETWGIDPGATGCSGWATTIPTPFKVGTWDGASHNYKVYHQSNLWKFFVGSTLMHSQPEADICWTPTQAHFFDETWDEGDAIGGSSSNHLRSSSTNYANAEMEASSGQRSALRGHARTVRGQHG